MLVANFEAVREQFVIDNKAVVKWKKFRSSWSLTGTKLVSALPLAHHEQWMCKASGDGRHG